MNEIGISMEREYGVKFLRADFKKGEGYKLSVELTKAHGIYRQSYCGCEFSLRDARVRMERMGRELED